MRFRSNGLYAAILNNAVHIKAGLRKVYPRAQKNRGSPPLLLYSLIKYPDAKNMEPVDPILASFTR